MTPGFQHAVTATLLALAVIATTPAAAQEAAGVDDVMMSVIDEGDANEETFAEEIRLPGSDDGGEGPPEDARGAADDARELRNDTGERTESARDLGTDAAGRGQQDGP